MQDFGPGRELVADIMQSEDGVRLRGIDVEMSIPVRLFWIWMMFLVLLGLREGRFKPLQVIAHAIQQVIGKEQKTILNLIICNFAQKYNHQTHISKQSSRKFNNISHPIIILIKALQHSIIINMTQAPSATFWQQFKTPILIASALAAIVITKRLCVGPPNTKDRDLTDQVIVITGANAGIGKETMKALALKNCKIVFGARDVQKSHQVHDQIIKEINPHAKIEFIKLDLADKDSILNFTKEIKEKYKRIDILINNAGIFLPNRTITANGFEGHIGINHLGHFYLTYLLWPLLTKAPHFRVINVSSDAHRAIASKIKSPLDLEDFHYKRNYSGLLAYAKSKAANVIFTKELQRRIDKKKLNGICVSLHPGVVVTQIGRYFTGIIKVLSTIIFTLSTLFTKNAQQGAQTTLYTVLASQQQLQKGAYYKDCSVCQAESFTSTPQIGSKLWQISESQLQIQFQV